MRRVAGLLVLIAVVVAGAFFARQYLDFVPGKARDNSVTTAQSDATAGGEDVSLPVIEAKPYEEPERPDFAFRRLEIETSGESPEACLVFTRGLDASGKTRYEDYLGLDPAPPIAVRASADRLCIAGLAFNEQYTLEIKKGLPAATGETLAIAETLPVQLRDQEPRISFGNGFILPRESSGGVPITTINVEEIEIRLIRVGDRLLSQLRSGIVDERETYPYDAEQVENEQGSLVWSGRLKTDGPRNVPITTAFPIRDVLEAREPGVYLILAKNAKAESVDDYDWRPLASQWVIDSDLGLTSFMGDDGLTIFVRSFDTADTEAGIKLALVARNNEILGEAITDGEGRAQFDAGLMRGEGGNEPVVVMAYGAGGDFAYLDLRRPAFDLTDRGVGGRSMPGPVDAYLYLDRGIYRPGETVQLVGLLRDRQAEVVADLPLTIIVSRPDGSEFKRETLNEQTQGAAHLAITLTQSAPRGRWQAAAYTDPNAAPIARIGFDVQDFVPQRLKLTLSPTAEILRPGQEVLIDLESRFLYGAPAAGLTGEGEITILRDPNPFPDLKGYAFGRVDERFDSIFSSLAIETTDAAGKSTATGVVDAVSETSLPLKANVRIALYEPGGRTTDDIVSFPVRTREAMIGIRPLFDGESVREGTPAQFEIMVVDATGKPIARDQVTYELVREEYGYSWYRTQEGDWRYQSVRRDRIVEGGALDVSAEKPASYAHTVDWGSYRLTLIDPVSGASSSVRFWGGWGAGAANDRPDRVAVLSDRPEYTSGETARIEIRAPSDGKALIAVATDRIIRSQMIDVSASGTTVELPVSADWGAGAYVLVTHYRPLASAEKRAPVRAIGLTYLKIDMTERTLGVDLGTPERVTPRGAVEVPITVTGAKAGEETWVTLAAVDEGILQLTDFVSPDPAAYYFGKRQLGLQVRDDYGRLILSGDDQVGALRQGGDGFGGRSLAVVPQRTVALFEGPVRLTGGKATITLDVPDFNGELRLMAVAFGPSAVGSVSKPLVVRDAVVGEVVLPRFLAPGDTPEVGLNLHNVEGAAGTYRATITADGPIALANGAVTLEQELAVGERTLLPVAMATSETGIATVKLTVEGPGGYSVSRAWPIEVRAPQLPRMRETTTSFAPGEVIQLGPELIAGLVPGTEAVSFAVAGERGFNNVAGQLRWLDRYPFGCLEQTTSRAFPLVYFNDMALLAGVRTDTSIQGRVQEAIDRILDQQRWSGGFSMWLGAGEDADAWLGAFALDFLLAAKGKGYVVPNEAISRGMKWLQRVAARDGYDDAARAYAFYILARQAAVNPSDLRYFADTRGLNVYNAIGSGMLGVALLQIGDRSRAHVAFARARDLALDRPINTYTVFLSYDSLLRDVAGLAAIAAEAGERSLVPALVARTGEFNVEANYTTTQEKAWMLLAAHAIEDNAPEVNVSVKGVSEVSSGKTVRATPTLAEVRSGITLENKGSEEVYRIVSVDGVSIAPMPAESSGGLEVNKQFYSLDGKTLDGTRLQQNERMIVLISGNHANNLFRQMAVIDLLPAGWQVEAPVARNDDGSSLYSFLPPLTATNVAEGRDDRYVATFDLGDRYRDPRRQTYSPQFAIAYIVRATTPGTYALPAVQAEDMYSPTVIARTAMAKTVVTAAP